MQPILGIFQKNAYLCSRIYYLRRINFNNIFGFCGYGNRESDIQKD